MESLSTKDLQVFREKSRTFCGSFQIPLDKLQAEELPDNLRQRNDKDIARLLNEFSAEDQRLEPENHVLALVSRSALPQPSRPSGNIFEEPQWFIPESTLQVLRGGHLLEAARKFFKGSNRWWVADLYSEDISFQVKNGLREQDPNFSRTYDGDIVRQIRISTLGDDAARRRKWLAKFSKSKQKCLLRLEALPEKFVESLDALTPFAGLWPAVQIGTFPRLCNLHCPEELTRCLRRVNNAWTRIVGNKKDDQLRLDANTVAILRGRCPFGSTEDRAFVQMRMLAGDIFPAIKTDDQRSAIFDRICSIEYVIPSIHFVVENTKYLEPGARILKELLPNKSKGSISQQFRARHNGQASMKVQISEFVFEDRILPSGDSFWSSYRQVWLAALRHFPVMDGQAPRKDTAQQSSSDSGIEQRWWHELSSLASESGYRGLRRKYSDRKAADAKTIEDCVRTILPSKYYQIDSDRMRRIVQLNCQLIGDVPYVERMKVTPELTSDHDDCGSDISDRCGRPRDHSFQADEESLFLDHIYSTSYSTLPKRYLTSFGIKRDFFHSFFGSEADDLDQRPHLERSQVGITKNQDVVTGDQDHVTKDQDEVMGDQDHVTKDQDEVMGDQDVTKDQNEMIENQDQVTKDQNETTENQDHITKDEEISAGTLVPYNAETQLASQPPLTLGGVPDTMEDNVGQEKGGQPRPPMREFGQQNQDGVISFTEASRLLFKTRMDKKKRLFTVLSPMAGNRFHKRQADSLNKLSMVTALELSYESRFVARDNGKRLKLTAPTNILEDARSEKLQAVLKVRQPNVQELIRQFENYEESEEEL